LTSASGPVLERELRIIVSDAISGDRLRFTFRVRWRAAGEKQVTGELRKPADDESGAVVGRITSSWRSFTDGFGPLGGTARFLGGLVRNPDPATTLSEVELDIDAVVAGRPIHLGGQTAESRREAWTVYGRPADWWSSVLVYQDGLPTPQQFTHA
jgi:hypothetical protein